MGAVRIIFRAELRRRLWRSTPPMVIAGLVLGVMVIANALAFVPAVMAMRGKVGALLRTQ